MDFFGIFNWWGGWTSCRVSGAVPAAFFNRCAEAGIELGVSAPEGELAARVRLRSRDLSRAKRLAEAVQCSLEPLAPGNRAALGAGLLRRWFAVLGLSAALAVLFLSRFFIWEVHVSGNEKLSAGRILDGLRECGVSYGSFWPSITSDNLRSELLTLLPELSWATVNIYGSRAEVIVRERVEVPELWDPLAAVDVRAGKTGFVRQVRVLSGVPAVRAGKAVTAGELLISGRAESAYGGPRTVHAAGSVLADTFYELTAVLPAETLEKRYTGREEVCWALDFGKSRRYFFENSSISPDSCDTITQVWNFGLGDLFSLPLRLLRQTRREYRLEAAERSAAPALALLRRELHERLLSQLSPGGEILQERYSAGAGEGLLTLCLRAACREEIGVEAPAGTEPSPDR